MKKYLTTAGTIFFGTLLLFNIIILIGLFGMWQLERYPDMFVSEGFWSLVRVLLVFSLIIPIFTKFKIVKT